MDKVAFEQGAEGFLDVDSATPSHAVSVPANVSMKLPAWLYAAKVWFVQAEEQFAIKHVRVSKTKFYQLWLFCPR